jgi:hypothetical protein
MQIIQIIYINFLCILMNISNDEIRKVPQQNFFICLKNI